MPARIHIPIGEHISRFVILGPSRDPKKWLCLCICGRRVEIPHTYIRNGHTKSCGCSKGEFVTKNKLKHGQTGSKAYKAWANLKERCTRQAIRNFQNYGGRGITFCQRWESFDNFISDMGYPPSKNHSIDRIDNNQGYSPENCRWATDQQQAENRRCVRWLTVDGITDTLKNHCRRTGTNYKSVMNRIGHGMEPYDAFSKPMGKSWKSKH